MTDFGQNLDESGHIAVIGMAGRFPGARDIDEFWHNLASGLDTITREPVRPVRTGAVPFADGPTYVPARGLLEHPEWFDAGYFGYSDDEAHVLDPQFRVFLECAVAALEHAGRDPDRCPGPVGVYGGSTETAHLQTVQDHRERFPDLTDDDLLLAAAPEFLASRTAERLGLSGPATTVQSACATALVAVHLAVQGLLGGDCDLALAGGVAVHVPPKQPGYSEDGILSSDGVTRTFDARGDGTVASSGVGIVVLKRLTDALADGDKVLAVVRGSAVTNDGSARIGFTAPSVEGQSAAIRAAQLTAGVDAGTITYVEAHGTATPLGDPVEVAALTRAFQQHTDELGFCSIGSVKSNIGHADTAAGAAGLIKTILALEHAAIPPSLHFQEPNREIDFASGPFRVATRYTPWRPRVGPRRAGVSAFGIGGVNSHVVLEEAPAPRSEAPIRSEQLLVVSARTPAALSAAAANLAAFLRRAPETVLADVAWTLQTGRQEHPYRAFTVADRAADAAAALTALAGGAADVIRATARDREVVLLLPGTGGRPGPGWHPLAEPEYERSFAACLDALAPEQAAAVHEALSGTREDRPSDLAVHDICVFAREYSLARLWIRWGVRPAGVFGTGTGALVAAVLADVLDLPDALRLLVARAHCAESGGAPTLDGLVAGLGVGQPRIPLLSAQDACWYDAAGAAPDAAWWAREWSGSERGDVALAALLAEDRVLLQPGPGTVPSPSAWGGRSPLTPLGDSGSEGEALASVLGTLGRLWADGVPVGWSGFHDGVPRAKVHLPGYPFERRPYLLRPPEPVVGPGSAGPVPGAPWSATAPAYATTRGPADSGGPDGGTLPLVLDLFRRVLALSEVDPEDSFFDLGGDSLIAARVLAEVREHLPVEITVKSLFAAPTALEFAEFLDARLSGSDPSTHGTQE
ncbi:type I polyketide synthase [Streptomyces sp. ISL-94]|uniref:type I polyketide synthase n=1 Tax=Streptomyces sp. ISL-94 TaxID=2819190 RepID=UPI001BE898DD|nr:beta-ketoacyl synthase N-terminal-like domain-containing protein [Streptomyces sp. ISL-94]MBT2481610.1 beta-ketoacyl synthase [Streptomyces sp. ISL-94]